MGCSTCINKTGEIPAGCNNNGSCATSGCGDKLDVYDWLNNVYYIDEEIHYPRAEVKFKGTRKEIYQNPKGITIHIGDMVVVETPTGHDVGRVSLVGELVKLQMKKNGIKEDEELPKILRRAGDRDIETYKLAKERELPTMFKSRKIAGDLGLVMKLSDIEFQGDNRKATFFYTADGRVDFRELIKQLAKEFKIKVEMRQIGLRQEAGRLGGIGDCGRELCCSTWLTDFNTVPTAAAKYQNLFLNPLKLSGQCGRLKCCLNYELDTYLEVLEDFPDDEVVLETKAGQAKAVKKDILKRVMWYQIESEEKAPMTFELKVEEVNKILDLNKQGIIPEGLSSYVAEKKEEETVQSETEFFSDANESSLSRFDEGKKRKKKKRRKKRRRRDEGGKKQ